MTMVNWRLYETNASRHLQGALPSVMNRVQGTGEPVIVTKRGTPVVKVVPVEPEKNDIFGFMIGKVRIVGDIESPIPVEWEVEKK
jgi:prevent-host-death family protein